MLIKKSFLKIAFFLPALLALSINAEAVTLRHANKGDLKSLDPHTLNVNLINGVLSNVYEGLVTRDAKLKIIPGLAEKWENPEPKRWRFYLRKGVKFHDGEDFTADDVLFSAKRARAEGSNFIGYIPEGAKFVKINSHTIDVILTKPIPTLISLWHSWFIMSRSWSEKHNSTLPTPASALSPNYASLHTNGTGSFKVVQHEPGIKTVFKPNNAWWNKDNVTHNFDEVIFTTIANDATRVASLLSGEIDFIDPVPLQDIPRVSLSGTTNIISKPELRIVYLGYDQARNELLESNIKGKNPFKDARVREAFTLAIDKIAIQERIMRGLSQPTDYMVAKELLPFNSGKFISRFNPQKARALLKEAGYPDGFEIGMDCPNNRYINDELICQAVVSMLAKVRIKVKLNAQPKAQFFAKVLRTGGYRTSFYLLGWTPDNLDPDNVLYALIGCRGENTPRGESNVAGYCNPEVDKLTDKILIETDLTKRGPLIKKALQTVNKEYGYLPLHQQSLIWGLSKKLEAEPRADGYIIFQWMKKK